MEKLDWFVERYNKVVSRPLREIRELGPSNQAVWDLNLGAVAIICSVIEALVPPGPQKWDETWRKRRP
jgi:hypothetical protein